MSISLKYLKFVASILIFWGLLLTLSELVLHRSSIGHHLNSKTIYHILSKEINPAEGMKDSSLTNKLVLINIWATWCTPCKQEMPYLKNIAEKYQNEKNVVFVAITDEKSEKAKSIFEKSEIYNLFNSIYEGRAIINRLYELENSNNTSDSKSIVLPTTILIKNGKMLLFKRGYSPESLREIDEKIAQHYLDL